MEPRKYKPYIFFIGRLEAKKNTPGLLQAFRLLKEKYHIPHELVLLGKPGTGCPDLSVPGVHALGWVKDRESFLEAADVFVFPSFYEGFGIPILEAWKRGVPVVASDIPVFHEIGKDACIYFNPNSPEDMAKKIFFVLQNADERVRLQKQGRAYLENFSWDKAAQETWAVFQDVLKS